MDDSVLAPLEALIAEGVADTVPTVLEQLSESQLVFYLFSPVGYLEFDVELTEGEGDGAVIEVTLWPLFVENNEPRPYDLCLLDVRGYETLDTIQRSLNWGRLELCRGGEGQKQPILTRTDAIQFDASIGSYQYGPMLAIFEMLFSEALLVTPVLAQLSVGETVEASTLEFALTDVYESPQ